MSAQNFTQAIGAGASIKLPAGRFFMVRSATSAIDIETEGNPGSPLRFINISAGTRFGPVSIGEGWRFLRVTSAAAQNVEIIISDDGDFDVASLVSVAGIATTQEQPSATFATTVAETSFATANSVDVAANVSRRRITITGSSTNTGSLWIRDQAATTNGGIELQPGMFVELKTTAAFRIRNNSGANQSYSLSEEA